MFERITFSKGIIVVFLLLFSAMPVASQNVFAEVSSSRPLRGASRCTVLQGPYAKKKFLRASTAGAARVNDIGNFEAFFKIVADGMKVLCLAWGGPTLIVGLANLATGSHDAVKRIGLGFVGVLGGIATPGCVNWLLTLARETGLFH